MTAESLPLPQLWAKTVAQSKDRVNRRSFWEALEKAVAITIESDTLIIGLAPAFISDASHLNVSEHKNAIEQVASKLAGRRLSVRIIEGTTLDDWRHTLEREQALASMRNRTFDRRDRSEAEAQSWDSLHDVIARAYSGTAMRQLPQMKARFLTQMLEKVAAAMDELYPEKPDEATERHLARVIDKLAGSAELPSSYVALELERVRAARKPGS